MSTKYLSNIDLGQNELLNAVIQPLGSNPSSPLAGQIYYNTGSGALEVYNGSTWVALGTGTGTVTAVSVASTNGFAGTSSGGSTPALTLTTSITGILKGNGTAISAATSGTDYAPATSGTSILKGNGSGGFSNAVSNTDYAPVASPTFTGTVTVPAPSASGAAATKGYVDGVAQGLPNKYSAVAATKGTETFTVSAGSVTQISGTTLDGQSPGVNDYVLVKDAPASSGTGSAGSTQPGNGLYQVTGNTTNLSLSRAADMSGSNGPAGSFVFVEGGTQASSGWVVSAPSTSAAFTYGTTSIAFTQFSGAGEIIAGTGLSKSGNTLSLATLAGKYTATIGNGSSASITVTHNLGTQAAVVSVVDASTYVQYICDVTMTSTNVVTLGFASAPASNSLIVTVIG